MHDPRLLGHRYDVTFSSITTFGIQTDQHWLFLDMAGMTTAKATPLLPAADMSSEEENYFTCNLGQAAVFGSDAAFSNISDFVKRQAQDYPTLPAVGYFGPGTDPLGCTVLNFQDVYEQSDKYAEAISGQNIPKGQAVALMVRNLPDFLFAFLALIKLGSSVLLIAPQCTTKASAQLCKQCNASMLFQHDSPEDSVRSFQNAASEVEYDLSCYKLSLGNSEAASREYPCDGTPEDTAYLFHTSGTSTGIPKPIPQSHKAGAGVQHRFDGTKSATFTTTPLYHGGMADLFRAWTSNALIWLFPGEHLPITQKNVVKCLEVAQQAVVDRGMPPVKYFSSVPYVLQSMFSDHTALQYLSSMDIVGVGGAALPTEVGDQLVKKGVNLISRFGSAECGFVMSSHRNYANDPEWQYLRPKEGMKHLSFEPRDDGLCELVILSTWPFMSKRNRPDGSFATSDLFEPHKDKQNVWKYHSRADSQLTLVTGKKFDPAPVESAVAASSSYVADVLVFGNDRPYPGALIFRSKESSDFSDDRLLDEVWPAIEKLNAESQSHTRLSRNMLFPMPFDEPPMEKSSKGTLIRRSAEERYGHQIEQAYTIQVAFNDIPDDKVTEYIRNIVQSTMDSSDEKAEVLDENTDLFAHGIDSIASIQIRSKLRGLLAKDAAPLPATIVEDSGNIGKLSQAIINLRHGKQSEEDSETQFEAMQELVSEYSVLPHTPVLANGHTTRPAKQGKETILITGATGSLGSNLLFQLLKSSQVEHIHLLVRGASPEASKQRLVEAFTSRELELPTNFDSIVSIHPYVLSDDRMGLSEDSWAVLAREVDIIIHLAWSVNFLMPLGGFRQHFGGLRTLLGLASSHAQFTEDGKGARFVFCSSTASVASFKETSADAPIPEEIVADPQVSGSIGYSRSKWVAELICSEVSKKHRELDGLVDVVRVGQVSGHSESGVWNASEAYPLLLSSARLVGCLPKLDGEELAWLPVDKAAAAFVQLAVSNDQQNVSEDLAGSTHVFYTLNPEDKTSWNSIISWIQKSEKFEIVPVQEWLHKLEELRSSGAEDKKQHPCLKLLDFWKSSYGTSAMNGEDMPSSNVKLQNGHLGCEYAMVRSKQAMPILTTLKPLGEEYVGRLWSWVKRSL